MLRDILSSVRRQRLTDPRAWAGRVVVWLAAIAVGLAVVAFAELCDRAYQLFMTLHQRWFWLPLVLTPCVGITCVWLTRRYFAGAEGGGIPQVIAAGADRVTDADAPRFVSLRIAIGKFGLVLAALAGGFSVGREGPSVQIGACLMHACRRLLPRGFAMDARHLLVAGGAAGMAAAFNTPLAGIVFAIEQLARRFEQGTNGVLIAAIVWAGLVSLALLGNYTYFGRLYVGDITLAIVPVLLVAGVVCGLAGGLFARLVLSGTERVPWLARWRSRHPLVFAGACGLAVAALGLATAGATFGGGTKRRATCSPAASRRRGTTASAVSRRRCCPRSAACRAASSRRRSPSVPASAPISRRSRRWRSARPRSLRFAWRRTSPP